VSFSTTKQYHSSLAYHPASSPCVDINHDSKSAILFVLEGPNANITISCAEEILETRNTKKFTNLDQLREFVLKHRCSLKDAEMIVF